MLLKVTEATNLPSAEAETQVPPVQGGLLVIQVAPELVEVDTVKGNPPLAMMYFPFAEQAVEFHVVFVGAEVCVHVWAETVSPAGISPAASRMPQRVFMF